jgi:DNA-binding CsgD family transcriptional regulator/PAS domain-containing protein
MSSAISHQDLSDLIGRIYDCTLDPSRWDATLDAIRTLLQTPTAQLALADLRQYRILLSKDRGMDARMHEVAGRHLPEIQVLLEGALDNGFSVDEPLVSSRLFLPEVRAASPVFQAARSMGFIDFLQIALIRSPTRVAMFTSGRQEGVGVFGDREIELMRLLIPHLRRAVTISNVLDVQAIEKARLAETLDALKLGVVLANEDSRILHANRAAEEMMREGGPLRGRDGVLRAERGAASREIRSAIRQAARNESGIGKTGLAVRLTDEDGEAPVVAHVLPLAGGEIRSRLEPAAVAAVFVNPKVDDAASAQAVASTFGLTLAETRVLTRILTGSTVAEAAADLGVAPTTARTHLDSILAKTGTSRQSELIRLAAQIAPTAR